MSLTLPVASKDGGGRDRSRENPQDRMQAAAGTTNIARGVPIEVTGRWHSTSRPRSALLRPGPALGGWRRALLFGPRAAHRDPNCDSVEPDSRFALGSGGFAKAITRNSCAQSAIAPIPKSLQHRPQTEERHALYRYRNPQEGKEHLIGLWPQAA